MRISLLELHLRNFKGVPNFSLKADGKNVTVYGDNGTGKTTLQDGFSWLLFDKDSKGQSKFEIKTLDKDNNPIHNLEHEVEGVFEVDGKRITLKKIFKEVYTRKRGLVTEEFSGHTTDHYIDEIPVKQSEYKTKVAEIVDEEVFKLVTSPTYFNDLHWEKRRKILLEISGDLNDAGIIQSRTGLAELTEILTKRSIEDHKKLIKSKMTTINKELTAIPDRIDENTRSLTDVSQINEEQVKKEIGNLQKSKKIAEDQLTDLRNGGGISEVRIELQKVEVAVNQVKINHTKSFADQITACEGEIYNLKSEINDLKFKVDRRRTDILAKQSKIDDLTKEADDYRAKWFEARDKAFEYSADSVCPTCGKPIDEWKLDEARQKAEAEFNRQKAEQLEKISDKGKKVKIEIEKLQGESKQLNKQIDDMNIQKSLKADDLQKAQSDLDRLHEESEDYDSSEEFVKAKAERDRIKSELLDLEAGVDTGQIENIEIQIADLDRQVDELKTVILTIENNQKAKTRIEELKQQQKTLAKEYEELERQMYLCEEFTRAKVSIMEERLNSKFKLAKFKLFEEQINGGLKDCCETLFEGVPYGSNLNSGARTNVGLDIINTLSQHYQFFAPIFVDNSESVTKLIPTESQLIRLVVSEQDKKLRVVI